MGVKAFDTYLEKIYLIETQEFTTCFDCPEFNKSRGYCKRANKSKPCIKKEQQEN